MRIKDLNMNSQKSILKYEHVKKTAKGLKSNYRQALIPIVSFLFISYMHITYIRLSTYMQISNIESYCTMIINYKK